MKILGLVWSFYTSWSHLTDIGNFHYDLIIYRLHQFSNSYHGSFRRTLGDYRNPPVECIFLFKPCISYLENPGLTFETTMLDYHRMTDYLPHTSFVPDSRFIDLHFFPTRLTTRGFFHSYIVAFQYVAIIPVLKPGLTCTNMYDRLTSRRRAFIMI